MVFGNTNHGMRINLGFDMNYIFWHFVLFDSLKHLQVKTPKAELQRIIRPVRLAYQPPASSIFLSEQISHQQPANSTFLSEQTSTSRQPPAKRTDW
jgi:hypothetical protein